jgi:hypothetical protein
MSIGHWALNIVQMLYASDSSRQAGNCICIRNKLPEHKTAVQGAEWTLDQVLDESSVPMRGVVLYLIFNFGNYRFVRLASVACY